MASSTCGSRRSSATRCSRRWCRPSAHQPEEGRPAFLEFDGQELPLLAPHLVQRPKGLVEHGLHHLLEAGRIDGLALFPDLQDLRDPEDVARVQRTGEQSLVARATDRIADGLEEGLIDLDHRDRLDPLLHGDRHFQPSASQALLDRRATRRLQALNRLRQAELHVEVTVVHAAQRDVDGEILGLARGGGKAGHRHHHRSSNTGAGLGREEGDASPRRPSLAPLPNICRA